MSLFVFQLFVNNTKQEKYYCLDKKRGDKIMLNDGKMEKLLFFLFPTSVFHNNKLKINYISNK